MVERYLGPKSIITKEDGESGATNWGKVRTGFLYRVQLCQIGDPGPGNGGRVGFENPPIHSERVSEGDMPGAVTNPMGPQVARGSAVPEIGKSVLES